MANDGSRSDTRFYWRAWWIVRDLRVGLWPIRVSLLVSLLVVVILWIPDQARESLQVLVEDRASYGTPVWRTLICALFAALSLWYWSRNLIYVLPQDAIGKAGKWAQNWGPRLCGLAPFIGLAAGFTAGALELKRGISTKTGMFGAAATCVGVGLLLIAMFVARRSVMNRLAKPRGADSHLHRVGPGLWIHKFCALWTGNDRLSPAGEWILCATFIIATAAFAAACFNPWIAVKIGPLGTILVCAGIWVALLTPFLVRATRWGFPLVIALLLLLGFSSGTDFNDNHMVRHLPTAATPPLPIYSDFEKWMASRPDYKLGTKYPVFIVATEGGGIRNAYWTALVLSAIQDKSRELGVHEFKDHLYCISGVSGGSVGAVVYAALVREDELAGTPRLAYAKTARSVLASDMLSPLLARGWLPDLAQEFIPHPFTIFDRQTAFEVQLERTWDAALGANPVRHEMTDGFFALRQTEAKFTSVPALLLNTTRVETGDRVLVGHANVTGIPSVFGDLPFDIPLSTAGSLSARFPIVTPVGSVEAPSGKTRFADGGYFENSGAATAQDALRDLLIGRIDKTGPVVDAEFHIIVIRLVEARITRPGSAWGEVMSPMRALLNTRGARGRDALASLQQFAADNLESGVMPPVMYEFTDANVRLPLGWQLSKTACDDMEHQMKKSPKGPGISDNPQNTEAIMKLLAPTTP